MQYIFMHIDNKEELLPLIIANKNNASYLEKEDQCPPFKFLNEVCDVSPTFSDTNDILNIMDDLEIVIQEAISANDIDMVMHLKELFVLCKLGLWNDYYFTFRFFTTDSVTTGAWDLGAEVQSLLNQQNIK